MNFITDKQTLKDLNLLGKYSPNSIFSLYNKTKTRGGEKLLDQMFCSPLSLPDEINYRSTLFHWFGSLNLEFPVDSDEVELAESFCTTSGNTNYIAAALQVIRKKILQASLKDEEFEQMRSGIAATVSLIQKGRKLVTEVSKHIENQPHPYHSELTALKDIFCHKDLEWIPEEGQFINITFLEASRFNYIVRGKLQAHFSRLFTLLYALDVYLAVGNFGRDKAFKYAKALDSSTFTLKIKQVRHPGLEKGIANDLFFNWESNVLFLTGANMAGKSTFMKSVAVSVYLAHMGFPVAAEEMEFSALDGIYTSINVPDDISLGQSHFYAEVLRVKAVAESVSSGKNLLVIFDELFKGTNVKDAYDATLAVSEAFAEYRNCSYIISTHIIEVGEELKNRNDNIQFQFLPTVMDGLIPRYTYKLKAGVTTDRQGMIIIDNEKILEIIQGDT